jgi:hypothetical protein
MKLIRSCAVAALQKNECFALLSETPLTQRESPSSIEKKPPFCWKMDSLLYKQKQKKKLIEKGKSKYGEEK